jgi:prepilin-type N-terminal cleavage/methylation domain-containing protein
MRNRTGRRGSEGDDGFTLVELLLAIIIISVITVPLADVVIGYLKNTDATTERLLASHDVQITSAYWAQDVAGIGTRSTASPNMLLQSVEKEVGGVAVPYDSGLYPCGSAGTVIVRLAWDDSSGPDATTQVRVAYVAQTDSGQTELHRFRCNGSAVAVSDVTLAHEIYPSKLPVVECSTDTDCTHTPTVGETVTLNLTLTDPGSPDGWAVPLIGRRRGSS